MLGHTSRCAPSPSARGLVNLPLPSSVHSLGCIYPHRTKCLQARCPRPHAGNSEHPPYPTPLSGTPGGTRTPDPELRRLLLYPPELPGLEPPRGNTGMPFPVNRLSGRGRGIRTPDILLPKQVRYQTAPYPAALGTRSCHGRAKIVLSHSDFVKPTETLALDSRASAQGNRIII